MRKIVPILATLALLIAAFVFYIGRQPNYSVSPVAIAPIAPGQEPGPGGLLAGTGTDGWVVQYDGDVRSYQFRAAKYDPQPDGRVLMDKPVIEIFPSNGEIIHIEGADGVVRVAPGEDQRALMGAPTAPPRYGTIRDVIVKIFRSADQQPDQPEITVAMNNAEFDNDTFRLSTQPMTNADGSSMAADQVPVTVHAADFDFDGLGLVMEWNGQNREIRSILIDHGQQLTINHASGFLGNGQVSATPKSQAAPTPSSPVVAKATPSATRPTTAPANTGGRYLATFSDNVRIRRGGVEVASGDEMQVDFAMKDSSPETDHPNLPPPATAPATRSKPSPADQETPSNATPPAAIAASQPDEQEVRVWWNGPLLIVPEPAEIPLPEGQSIVRLTGSPVHLHSLSADSTPIPSTQPDTDAVCSELEYRTADGTARLTGTEQLPVRLTQKRNNGAMSTVTGFNLLYSSADHVAHMIGKGESLFTDPANLANTLDATWDRDGVVHMSDSPSGQSAVTSVDLLGNVAVKNPKFDIHSNDLIASFNPPDKAEANASPQLKMIVATGDADCEMHDADGLARSMAGQKIELVTDNDNAGKIYAKTVTADGQVHAHQDEDDLFSGHMKITFGPAQSGGASNAAANVASDSGMSAMAGAWQEIDANDSVRVTGKNGSTATGDHLIVTQTDQKKHVILTGKSDVPARVSDANSTVTGPQIDVWPDDQYSKITGAGTLDTRRQSADATQPARPMHLKWAQSATVDGKANQIALLGQVDASSKSADGTIQDAKGNSLMLDLMDAPTTRPATKPASGDVAENLDFMGGKQLRSLSLTDTKEASVQTAFPDMNDPLRRFSLFGKRIDYDAEKKILTVPQEGKMGLEDYSPATRPSGPATDSSPGGRGMTAFQWEGNLVYDENQRTLKMHENVRVVHQDGPGAKSIELDSDTLIATFQPADSTQPAATASDSPRLDLRHFSADGNVVITSGTQTIRCQTVDFDPATSILTCTGGEGGLVTVKDSQHTGGQTARVVEFNTRTNMMEKMADISGGGR